jgi:hypothetical protein
VGTEEPSTGGTGPGSLPSGGSGAIEGGGIYRAGTNHCARRDKDSLRPVPAVDSAGGIAFAACRAEGQSPASLTHRWGDAPAELFNLFDVKHC